MSDGNKIIIEERHLPEDEGFLGSKTTSTSQDGSLLKDFRVPFCDCCGKMLRDEPLALCSCKRKICQSCVIQHEGKIYCRDCAKQRTGITKEHFFILYGIAKEKTVKDIKTASSLNSTLLENSIQTLTERKLIEKKGLLFFTAYKATSSGLALLATCEQIYCNEKDVQSFLSKLSESTTEDET